MDNQAQPPQQSVQPPTFAPPPPTQSNTLNVPEQSHSASHITVLVLLFLFPPAAWYIMWKNKQYHSWFPMLLILNALIPLVTLIIMLLFVVPQLMTLYNNLNVQPNFSPYPLIITAIILSGIQILFAIYIRQRVKKYGQLSQNLLVVTLIFLITNFLITFLGIGAIQLSIISPIYNLINTIQ